MTKTEKIVRRFIENSYNANVVGALYVNPTPEEVEEFLKAREEIGIKEYRRISAEETERFKKKHDL